MINKVLHWILSKLCKVSKRDTIHRYYVLKILGWAIFIHHHLKSEDEGIYHTHPWDGLSIMFGSYMEQKLGDKLRKKRIFNRVKATTPHRVDLHNGPMWTIFIHQTRYNRWAVFNEAGEKVDEEPWRGVEGERTKYNE